MAISLCCILGTPMIQSDENTPNGNATRLFTDSLSQLVLDIPKWQLPLGGFSPTISLIFHSKLKLVRCPNVCQTVHLKIAT